jgi:hypothetical protein
MAEQKRQRTGRTWVLETQTKGTGANMVPLERSQKKQIGPAPQFSFPKLKPRRSTPKPRQRRLFKIVDVVSREVLADGVGAKAAIRRLKDVRSIVDVNVFVWEPTDKRWRRLTLSEVRILWSHRGA